MENQCRQSYDQATWFVAIVVYQAVYQQLVRVLSVVAQKQPGCEKRGGPVQMASVKKVKSTKKWL